MLPHAARDAVTAIGTALERTDRKHATTEPGGAPKWEARRRLLRNREDLTDTQFSTMWNQLIGTGDIGMTLLTAWIAKGKLRDLLARARTTDRHRTGHLRWKFSTWCADCDIPEARTLARTIDRWWPEIQAFIATGHSNAKSEGINRMIKLAARAAHGFRNPTNQRLRTRCVTTRRARGHRHPA
ncbi:transposase [Streptomyces milbemycinicus]